MTVESYWVESVPVAPDPLLLAGRLADVPGAFLLHAAVGRPCAFLGAEPLASVEDVYPEPELPRVSREHPTVPRWIGILPYEAFRDQECHPPTWHDLRPVPALTRCRWWRYGAVAVVADSVTLVGDDRDAMRRLRQRLLLPRRLAEPAGLEVARMQEPEQVHAARVEAALVEIARGNIYQVNLARVLTVKASGSALALGAWLSRRSPAPFGFALDAGNGLRIIGASPELCLTLDPRGSIKTCPIKGTRPRGLTQEQDTREREALASDPKERAELAMVVDLERNDLGRVSIPGSVVVEDAGRIESYHSVHHRVATVTGRLRPGLQRADVLRQFLPSGSVTGAPKRASMTFIARLESQRRGLYTGAYGYLAHDGTLRLAMAIRTMVVEASGWGTYWVGGGIVADSKTDAEVQETGWKSRPVLPSEPDQPDWGRLTPTIAENWSDLALPATDDARTSP